MSRAASPYSVPADTVVAIDGPAGSGKSTTARALADRFGLLYVDTGAMYRALTWAALDGGVRPDDGEALERLLADADLELDPARQETRVHWNGRDISGEIRTPGVESQVSAVAAHQGVRAAMVERQRAFARRRGVVMEGRDIGTVVFPLATAKIYLDASIEARAERRLAQHRRRGNEMSFDQVVAEVAARDKRDSEREESPLSIPPDAVVVDNSNFSLDEQLDRTADAVMAVLAERDTGPLDPDCPTARPDWRYRIAYAVFTALARAFGLKIGGREYVETCEGQIVACNHVSNWDPPMLGAALAGLGHYRSVAKEELFKIWPMGPMFRFLDAIPIKRRVFDEGAFLQVERFLGEGQNVVFFPEGTRRVVGEPGPVRTGLGTLMQRSGAPAVPAFVRGTPCLETLGSPSTPLELVFAPPVRLRALPTLRERHDEREISRLVAALFEQIYLEMQARSHDRAPFSEAEREQAERMRPRVARKDARTFRNRAS